MSSSINVKYNVEQYQLCVAFKSDSVMSMSVQFLPTGQHFLNQTIQLIRIKKDTVIATLQRKSQKNLKCNFQQIVDKENKYLVIKFIVSFDFLPQFSEEVQLQYVEKKESIKHMQAANFKADIQVMQRMINAFQKNGTWKLNQIGNVSGNSSTPVLIQKLELSKGRYLLRASGIYTYPLGQMGLSNDVITFQITIPGQKQIIKKFISMNSYSGYSCPYAYSQLIESDQGQVKIQANGIFNQWTLTNNYVVIFPVGSFK